jgi:hypothetical protein
MMNGDIKLIFKFQKPLTLTEVVDKGHYDSSGLFLDRGNRFTLLEAINSGCSFIFNF